MASTAQKNPRYFERYGVTENDLQRYLGEALSAGGDYADLYFEHVTSISISIDESMIKSATQGISAGCGVRVIAGVRAGYADEVRRILVVGSDGAIAEDMQPLSRLSVFCIAKSGTNSARGTAGGGGRIGLDRFADRRSDDSFPYDKTPEHFAREAAR